MKSDAYLLYFAVFHGIVTLQGNMKLILQRLIRENPQSASSRDVDNSFPSPITPANTVAPISFDLCRPRTLRLIAPPAGVEPRLAVTDMWVPAGVEPRLAVTDM